MANASNIAARQFINGVQTIGWTNLSSSNTTFYAGKVSDSANDVVEFRFTLSSAASSITLSWFTGADTIKGKPMYYHLGTSESSSYQNATNVDHGDGTLNTAGYAFTNSSNTISGTFQAGTYYLYIWQGPTSGSDTYIHTSIFFTNASYPTSVTYAAVSTYSLTASVSAGVSLTVTITSSPYGRSGTLTPPATVMHGEVLQLNWSLTTGYAIGTHTINGTTFSQGASTGSVSFNCNIVLTANYAIAEFNSVPSAYTTGTASTITVTRYSSSYSHSVQVIQGGTSRQTLSISWSGNNGTISWTPSDATYAPLNTSGGSVNVTLRLLTTSGGSTIGYKDASATITFGTGVNPIVNLAITDKNNLVSTYGAYVQNRSQFHVVVTDGLQYGASVVSRTVLANGATYSSSTFDTGVVQQSGYNTISATVRDSRGRSTTYTQSGINVLAYSAPYASTFAPHRTDSGGTLDEAGGYFTVDWAVVISSLNSHNAKDISIDYKLTSSGTWTTAYSATLSSYTQSGTSSPVAISTDSTYDVRIQITDDFGTVTQSAKLSTIPATLDLLDGGFGVAIGKVAEMANLLDVAWNAKIAGDLTTEQDVSVGGELSVSGNVSFGGSQKPKVVVAEGNSGIWHYAKYSDGTAELWGVATAATSSWSTWGAWYYAPSVGGQAYPFSFTSVPVVTIGLSAGVQSLAWYSNTQPTVSNAPIIVPFRPTAGNTADTATLRMYVWGRWQ